MDCKKKSRLSYKGDLLKPLFCWMFAHILQGFTNNNKDMDVGIARLILYSTFIHSILKGKYEQSLKK